MLLSPSAILYLVGGLAITAVIGGGIYGIRTAGYNSCDRDHKAAMVESIKRAQDQARRMKAAIVLITLLLAGCAEYGAVKSGVQTHGAMAADEALEIAKWQTCQAASIGSLERELGGDRERIAGWVLWCGKKPGNSPLIAPSPPTVQPQGSYSREEGVKRALW